jgi:hypothetical protein
VDTDQEHSHERPGAISTGTQILLLVLFATALAVLAFAAASVVLV